MTTTTERPTVSVSDLLGPPVRWCHLVASAKATHTLCGKPRQHHRTCDTLPAGYRMCPDCERLART